MSFFYHDASDLKSVVGFNESYFRFYPQKFKLDVFWNLFGIFLETAVFKACRLDTT